MTKIVVGVDGSDQSRAALVWADREAHLHDATLVAVLAWDLLAQHWPEPEPRFDPTYGDGQAQVALDAYIGAALDPVRAALVERQTPCDLPAPALLGASVDASLVVVGSRGRGGFAGLLLGSVSSHLLNHLTRPLAIVRRIEPSGRSGSGERIVVGVDGSDTAEAALRWAAEEARRRRATLVIVHSWHLPYATGYPYAEMNFDPTGMGDDAREVLAAAEALVSTLGIGQPVETFLHLGDAAAGILEAATSADLIVAGSRGLGGFTGMALGSVTHHLAHHAPCPLVIVPPAG